MKMYGRPKTLPRYFMFITVAMVVIFQILIAGVMLLKHDKDSKARQETLEQDIFNLRKDLLIAEVSSAENYINYMIDQSEVKLKKRIRSEVLKAYNIISTIYQKQRNTLSKRELKSLIIESLRNIRFLNGRGYFFIDDTKGNVILLPPSPELEGKSLYDKQDDTGHYVKRGLIQAVNNSKGEGFSHYRWRLPYAQNQIEEKVSFVKLFEPYNWIIGAGDYIYQAKSDIKKQVLERLRKLSFGENGYLVVLDKSGRMLTSRGVSIDSNNSHFSHSQQLELKIMETARKGGGFIEYDWFYPNGEGPYRKISYINTVPKLGWILAAGMYVTDIEKFIQQQKDLLAREVENELETLYKIFGLIAILTLILMLILFIWISRTFNKYNIEIEDKRHSLEKSSKELQLAYQVFDSAKEGIVITDSANKIVMANDAFVKITGYSRQEVIGNSPSMFKSGYHDQSFYNKMWNDITTHKYWSGEVWNKRKNGEIYPEWLSIIACLGQDSKLTNYIAFLFDITEQKEAENKLKYLSDYDILTSLPNRKLLRYHVEQIINLNKNKDYYQLAFLYIDLDHFKNINDSLGHSFGDKILKKLAKRLQEVVGKDSTVSRLGGDEFMIMVPDVSEIKQLNYMAELLIKCISEPFESDNYLQITSSIGIAVYPNDGNSFEDLLSNADSAVNFAKQQGRNNYQFFTTDMNINVSQRLEMEIALRKGMDKQELVLYYQPQFSLKTGDFIGVEALIRWMHPQLGMVAPDSFIPLAEETGLIIPIGSWVLSHSCKQAAKWLKETGSKLTISVNVSVCQFRSELVYEIVKNLEDSGLPPDSLIIEITESTLMKDSEMSTKLLHDLKAIGVQISLDDFGTGYSSLAYLKNFNLDQLKIDRTFIEELPKNKDNIAITSSIIAMANHFGMVTVAEGVETSDQADFLAKSGCTEGQGFLYEKPAPAKLIESKYLL